MTEPTCTEGGYTTYTCETCGEEKISDFVEPKGHTYLETVTLATCVSYGYTEHKCSDCGDRYVTDYIKATGHTYLDIVIEATEDSVGYTRHLCVVCNYSYLSDFVTSGDSGYIEGEDPEPEHKHKYDLHVQDNAADKYFIALRVCACGDSKVGNLTVNLKNESGEDIQLSANEYGQVDYSGLYGNYIVTITDENGAELTMFDISAGEAPEGPDDGGEENPDEKPGDGGEENPDEKPGDGGEENPDEKPGDKTEPVEDAGKDNKGTAIILLVVFVLLLAGGIGAIIFMKKRKNKNQN